MASVTLLHPEETFTIPSPQAMNKCSLFQNNPTLTTSPYRVESPFSLSIFREFLSALEGNAINITDTNYTELQRLCNKFGFTEVAAKLSEFRPSMAFKEAEAEDADARGRIAALEEKANQHSHVIVMLPNKVTHCHSIPESDTSSISTHFSAHHIHFIPENTNWTKAE
jgi:hypothetical protein